MNPVSHTRSSKPSRRSAIGNSEYWAIGFMRRASQKRDDHRSDTHHKNLEHQGGAWRAPYLIGVLVLTGFDKHLETLLVNAFPQWLTDLTTGF